MKIIVGTGWWCANEDTRKIKYGDDFIRSESFSEVWMKSLKESVDYHKVVVVDSNSPIKSQVLINESDFEYINLLENGGHASNINGLYCGWSRGVILSMIYAHFSGCDYYVYVEQDVLLKGNTIIKDTIDNMTSGFAFGESKDYPQPLQQSLFVIDGKKIMEFVSRYSSIKYSDHEISCEVKFALCTSRYFSLIPCILFKRFRGKTKASRLLNWLQNKVALRLSNFEFLPISGGRDRPINFEDENYYFQHGTEEEIRKYRNGK